MYKEPADEEVLSESYEFKKEFRKEIHYQIIDFEMNNKTIVVELRGVSKANPISAGLIMKAQDFRKREVCPRSINKIVC